MEDVVSLGMEVSVRVDDIDPQGKVSLTPVGDGDEAPAPSGEERQPARAAAPTGEAPSSAGPASDPNREYASFEDTFEAQAKDRFGDLGPADSGRGDGGGDGGRGGPRRNRGRRGPGRR